MYYFFNPDTLIIVGASNVKEALSFPYIESEDIYHSFENLRAKRTDKDQQLYEDLSLRLTNLISHKEDFGLEKIDDYIAQCKDIKEQMKDPNSRATLEVLFG